MRIYRNNSTLLIVLFDSCSPTSAESVGVLVSALNDYLTEIDTAGFCRDGRIGILLPDFVPEAASDLATSVVADCRDQGVQFTYELLQYPDDPMEPVTGSGIENRLPPPPQSTSTAATFFSCPIPVWKRALDVVGASIGLVMAAPLILIAALLIKMSSKGTALFSQARSGQAGSEFTIHKIRTMRMGADKQIAELRHLSDQDGPAFKLKQDPRTLPIGAILRKLSIDELPQLWNVLRGDMSLVGPRPLPLDETEQLTLWQRERLDAKPGVTGPWQVSGRNSLSFEEWMRLDVDYVRNHSLWTDIKILLCTVPAVIFCRGAS